MKEKKEIATALKYEANKDGAPQLIAKGQGDIARKIKEIARELNIPTYQDEKLARQLYHLSLGEEIPPELYQVVAEILAFIVELDMKEDGPDDR
ncbi:EscU/YscU/HrcU family type III secretion system export apparatus switch protein [Thermotalea metallivorans]|uniref:Flagellar biosynthetic protein FlhB n=1 Tax=Thermotalea metallivorans TaxID=520762 RepID=A0A140L5A2_9FIRM|nr:EscU/YscU/HrcU family type III secretion system export apparatus switch protein [Thermotalea metallivorans]KXG75727.1 Flagellar biosynthetic protein FlhB [Thermotalea metallivorans]